MFKNCYQKAREDIPDGVQARGCQFNPHDQPGVSSADSCVTDHYTSRVDTSFRGTDKPI